METVAFLPCVSPAMEKEGIANERLICAAPAMLAALKDLQAILCDPEGTPCFAGSTGDLDVARKALAVIAQAEGAK